LGQLVPVTEGVMSISDVLKFMESSNVAGTIRNSLYLFPLIESFHVFGLTMVFGTIAVVDFRLLGIASTQRPFTRIATDILKWTWLAFALTATTGLLMFSTNANVYYNNPFFRTKMAFLALAGINMLIFELTAGRKVHMWDHDPAAPRAGKAAAALSILLWIVIIFLGRWTGFTTTGRPDAKADSDINIENLFPPPEK
jgi:hypothetical protein